MRTVRVFEPKLTVDELFTFVPEIERINEPSPAGTAVGEREVICGTGLPFPPQPNAVKHAAARSPIRKALRPIRNPPDPIISNRLKPPALIPSPAAQVRSGELRANKHYTWLPERIKRLILSTRNPTIRTDSMQQTCIVAGLRGRRMRCTARFAGLLVG